MKVQLGSFLSEVNEKTTKNNQYPVLTSSKSGLYLQSNYFNKQVASKDNTGYKIIKRNQFTYRAMSDTGKFFPNMLDCADVGIVSPAYPVFEISDKSVIIPEYLKYFFKSNNFQHSIASFAQGSTRTSVKFNKMKTIIINIPSIETQMETIEIIKKVSTIITHLHTQLEKLDLLVKARFVEMFGNIENMCTIADVCSIITDGTHQPPKFTTDGIPFLFVSNIATNEIVYNAEKFISEETYNDLYKRTPIEIGDIILSTVGSYGHPAIVKTNKKFLFQRHIAYLKPIPTTINSIYLHRAILSDNVQRQIDERVKGIAQKTLNLSEIRKIVIPAPPLELQTQFANFVKQVDQSKSILQQELTQTQTLFNSLMQEYFG